MEVFEQETSSENSGATSPGKRMPRSVKRKKEPRIADGDRIVVIVVAELKALGYPIELVNYKDNAGNLTAALVLTGKVWNDKGALEKQKEMKP